MKDFDEPRRLFESEEAPAQLRTWLARAHEDVPSSAAVEELVRGVERRANFPSSASGDGTRVFRASSAARHSTELIVLAAVVGVGAGVWYFGGAEKRDAGKPAKVLESVARPSEAPLPPADQGTPQGMAAANLPEDSPRPALAATSGAVATARSSASSSARPIRALGGGSRADTDTAASVVRKVEPSEPAQAGTNADEYRLLRAARQALAEFPARALALTEEHARRFPRGILGQEREAIAIEALVQLGREGPARARARSFFATYPSSPHRSRIERALARSWGAAISP